MTSPRKTAIALAALLAALALGLTGVAPSAVAATGAGSHSTARDRVCC